MRAYIYIYIWSVSRVPCSQPPHGMGLQVAPPSLLFASYWQHFWGPASYLLGLCSISDYQPRTHTHTHIHTYTHTHIHTYTHTRTHTHTRMHACIALHYITLHYIHQTPHHHRPQGVKTIRSKTGHASPTSQTLHHHRPWGGNHKQDRTPIPICRGGRRWTIYTSVRIVTCGSTW